MFRRVCSALRYVDKMTDIQQHTKSMEAASMGLKMKSTTGLVGVPVQPRWRPMMLKLCDDVLKSLDHYNIPQNSYYRVMTENSFRYFQKVVVENEDYEAVEELIDRGQVEELIMLFEDELTLIPLMSQWKAWEISEESIEAEKRFWANGGMDFALPNNFIYPFEKLKYKTWNGVYTTSLEATEQEQNTEKKQ